MYNYISGVIKLSFIYYEVFNFQCLAPAHVYTRNYF